MTANGCSQIRVERDPAGVTHGPIVRGLGYYLARAEGKLGTSGDTAADDDGVEGDDDGIAGDEDEVESPAA